MSSPSLWPGVSPHINLFEFDSNRLETLWTRPHRCFVFIKFSVELIRSTTVRFPYFCVPSNAWTKSFIHIFFYFSFSHFNRMDWRMSNLKTIDRQSRRDMHQLGIDFFVFCLCSFFLCLYDDNDSNHLSLIALQSTHYNGLCYTFGSRRHSTERKL